MTDFRTKIQLPSFPVSIAHEDSILALGSCFAENIGQRLTDLKFTTDLNPFGILYNPISIAKGLNHLLEQEEFLATNLFEHQGLWHSFAHHGSFSKSDKLTALNGIQERMLQAQILLRQTNRLLLTFGTAHVFEYRKTGTIVANCHKLPNQDFNRRCLSVDEIVNSFIPVFQRLKSQNTDYQIIATTSPIRHIRDGLIENQKSKSILRVALAELCESLDYVHYFPSYEILVDDLRDYRFYKADMIHPTTVATDYIWEHFQQAFFQQKTVELNGKIEKIRRAMEHRPFNVQSEKHQAFLKQQIDKIEILEKEFEFNFQEEKDFFNSSIKA